jgi:hypothetical protein
MRYASSGIQSRTWLRGFRLVLIMTCASIDLNQFNPFNAPETPRNNVMHGIFSIHLMMSSVCLTVDFGGMAATSLFNVLTVLFIGLTRRTTNSMAHSLYFSRH